MRYFIYRMLSDDKVPSGNLRGWLAFYKWGRAETVTFRRRLGAAGGLFVGAKAGDRMFFVLDGFLIGDARISEVRDVIFVEGTGLVQELDVPEGGITEYLRGWTLWDQLFDYLRLWGLKEEVPPERAARWLTAHARRVAVYTPGVTPRFFAIKKK